VVFFEDLPNKIQSADQDAVRGHVLTNGIDANGRLIAGRRPRGGGAVCRPTSACPLGAT
jgi:hypothetical protein